MVDVPGVPVDTVTDEGLKETVGPDVDETVPATFTVPEKPFMLVRVTIVVAVEP